MVPGASQRFDHGQLDGEATYWLENGKTSSSGTFAKGERTGSWRYWDEQGRLVFDVGYTVEGVLRDEFYPSGRKRASGTLRGDAKVGRWYMYFEDGGEKARFDFGEGLLALPDDDGCRIIADALEPRGFGRPIPKASVTEDGVVTVSIGPQAYAFTTPPGWVADPTAGAREGLAVVFAPKERAVRERPLNMYIRPVLKDGRTLQAVIYEERNAFAKRVGGYQEFLLPERKGRFGRVEAATLRYIVMNRADAPFAFEDGQQMLEAMAYIDVSRELALVVGLVCDWKVPMKRNVPTFLSLIESARPGSSAARGGSRP